MSTLKSFKQEFGHENRVIDILKVDIEHSEWDSFEVAIKVVGRERFVIDLWLILDFFQDGTLSKVKQLLFETHSDEVLRRSTSAEHYLRYMRIWQALYQLGFRQWQHHLNHFGQFASSHSQKSLTCCHEQYLVNINLLTKQ